MLFYRARFYDPQVGRFSSEDPIGLAGGINAYSYTNNNSLTRKDPSGLYDIDVHYYLTYYLAVSTGCFSGAEAREIAEGDQRSDEDEDKKPAWGNKIVWRWGQPIVVANEEQQERNARFHSFGDGYRNSLRANELWGLALKDGGNLGAFGTYHHFRQDSFSHGPYAGNTTWGQTTGGTQVDHTNFDPGLARQMAHATYSDLKAFAYWRGCGCVADPDWTKINAFINVGYASWNPVDFVWEVSDAQLREKIGILGVPWRSPNGR
jgi:uncharacterized protein RhaS with RHS repeats